MKQQELCEREFYINRKGKIFDNSLNENLEDLYLKENEEIIKKIFNSQSKEVKEVIEGKAEYCCKCKREIFENDVYDYDDETGNFICGGCKE